MAELSEEEIARRHREKMAKRKAVQDAEVASKTITEKGLLIVNTGPGKGKWVKVSPGKLKTKRAISRQRKPLG
jgi:hypothetical protein